MKPADYLSGSRISVRHELGAWVIAGEQRKVVLNESDLSITVTSGGCSWPMQAARDNDLTIAANGKQFAMSLTGSGRMRIEPYDTGSRTGIKIDLGDFRHESTPLDLGLQLFICLEGVTEDLVFDMVASEGDAVIKELRWPKAFAPEAVDSTVIPAMQGMLLPRNWPRKTFLYDTVSYGRGLYMPWWGHEKARSAAMVILETPEDAGCNMEHPAGGPTLMELRWLHSLGRLGYPRSARICFVDKGNYVSLAKRYRRYVVETGRFVSLREKIARNTLVARLIGAPVVHTGILSHVVPESLYYNKENLAANHVCVPFDTRADELARLAAKGIGRAYVHLDGWGCRGYDNLHPDILPPCPEAGGWEGMKKLADACDRLGFIFAIHDQYRDYYLDAASFSERHTILDQNGNRPSDSTWAGGRQSILCSSFAPEFVRRNHSALLARGVKVKGAYLDVFAVVPPDECYNPEHPITRAQCLKYRRQCFELVRSLLGVVSSEEPVDWAVPYLDLVHHGPFALDPNPGGGSVMGVPVPLFNLVYHDSIILPWTASLEHRGGWGIPKEDPGFLHGLSNAGIPYISLNPDEEELRRARAMCALHRRIGLAEMTGHEWLDAAHRKQRTSFADGTVVTVDFDSGSYEIKPELSEAELDAALSPAF